MAAPKLTDEQCQMALDALDAHDGNQSAAAASLDMNRQTFLHWVREGRRRFREFETTRVTTATDKDGNVTATYTQTKPDRGEPPPATLPGFVPTQRTVHTVGGEVYEVWEQQKPEEAARDAALRAAIAAMAADLPRLPPMLGPSVTNEDLCTVYTLTDAHIGMLAWHREGGADWDLGIAEATIVGCFAEAIRSTPAAHTAVLNQLGDLLHYDGLSAVTPTSGHILDADGRFTKMVEVAVRVLRRIIALLLEKHERVHLVLAEGNHDMASSVWLRTMFKALYEAEPRITVDDSALPYYAFEFGQVMQIFHHSHLKKFGELWKIIPAQFPEMWGRTKKRYCHTGNLHHGAEKEEAGLTIIQHPTLAARDAYAARGGWWAERAMSAITYHKRFGQVGRTTVCPEMLQAA